MKRIYSIDFARGLVMIIMTIDHTRDFLHVDSILHNPTDLTTTTPILFFTRWITHLCAPIFVFLSGLSAWLSLQNCTDVRENRLFLLKRGIWLIVLEFTVINLALWMDFRFRTLIFEVIGTIGAGFILLALLYKESPRVLGIVGLIIILSHNLFSMSMVPPNNIALKFIASLLMDNGVFQPGPNLLLIMRYPVLPWFGIMLVGFASGKLFEHPAAMRRIIFLRLGLAALALFVAFRYMNVYGDPAPWSVQKNSVYTFLSFMNITKYPPSLLFTLPTLGILFIILFVIEGKNNRLTQVVSVFGKTPLFYFVLHLYIIHLAMFVMAFLQGYHVSDLAIGTGQVGRPKGSGISLAGVYAAWLGVLLLMYPLCKWYGKYKADHRDNKWLRYF